MKIKFSLYAIVALLFAVFGCVDEPATLQKEKVQFVLDIKQSGSSGGRTSSEVPDGARVLISLSNSSGAVLTRHALVIHQFGSGHTTDPLELPVGNYSLTEFLIENSNGDIIMATPKAGSTLGDVIENALPINFSVDKGSIVNIDMQVVPVGASNPEDFGYTSFSVDVFNPFPIVVFIEEHGDLVMTEAKATFMGTEPFVRPEQDFALEAKINYLDFDGPHNEWYHLQVSKDGYTGYDLRFRYSELISSLGNGPLKIILRSDEVVIVERPATTSAWKIDITTYGDGQLLVYWSDGTVETHVFQGAPEHHQDQIFLSHEYQSENGQETQQMTIRGDLDKIFMFRTVTRTNKLDVSDLEKLETLMLKRADLSELDLSRNVALRDFIIDKTDIDDLTLGYNPQLKLAMIHDPSSSTATYDELAKELYENAVANHVEYGHFLGGFIPMSPVAKGFLEQLESEYHWHVDSPE